MAGATAAHAGPIREVFAAPWVVVVVPDDPTPHGTAEKVWENLGKNGCCGLFHVIAPYFLIYLMGYMHVSVPEIVNGRLGENDDKRWDFKVLYPILRQT